MPPAAGQGHEGRTLRAWGGGAPSAALRGRPLCQQLRAKAGGTAVLVPPGGARNVDVAPLHLQANKVGQSVVEA